jgi:hypothetical protein
MSAIKNNFQSVKDEPFHLGFALVGRPHAVDLAAEHRPGCNDCNERYRNRKEAEKDIEKAPKISPGLR